MIIKNIILPGIHTQHEFRMKGMGGGVTIFNFHSGIVHVQVLLLYGAVRLHRGIYERLS